MIAWLKRLIGSGAAGGDDRLLEIERECGRLRLAVAELSTVLETVKRALVFQREGENARVAAVVRAEVGQLLAELAPAVARFAAQARIFEQGAAALGAGDVLEVARQVIGALETRGLALRGAIGESVPFDAAQHAPLSAEFAPVAGDQVVVRIPGVTYQGMILAKAGVARE